MKIAIPIWIREEHPDKDGVKHFIVQPLFVPYQDVKHERLGRAMAQLTRDIRKSLHIRLRGGDTSELIPWTFCPEIEEHRYDLPIELRRRTAQCRLLVLSIRSLNRTLGFTPCVPDIWFEIQRGQTLRGKCIEVLTHHFRELEKKGSDPVRPEQYNIVGKAYTSVLEMDLSLPAITRRKRRGDETFALLFDRETLSGELELYRTGECLNGLYPDALNRAIMREPEVAELKALLRAPDRRPVLLIGPRQSGKTTVIHECVFQDMKPRKERFRARRNVWHLSPQRLVSGMSVVGQWEARLEAIMKEATRKDHTLYFDDLLGLYLAGVCASSTLSVAQVLKPHIEARAFRVLAESTPEAFRALQERDRGLADLFHIIRVNETTRDDTVRIMIAAMREHEEQHRCRYGLEVLPTIMEIQARYVHDAAFPGKSAAFAKRLAIKHQRNRIEREHVLEEFQASSGLSLQLLDGRQKLSREAVWGHLGYHLVGQDTAVQAMTDVICRAKARLNDPDRPLGAFLFVGPTGVGKTECAKAVASYLFGSAERLVRFDMNEYVDARAAARLVGTFQEPEGLLTSKIRLTPFCVLLLDEIEKAHADVFDLLLQVLGEGRLTDALGRTADFRNALIILTSNLGARKARSRLGFRDQDEAFDEVYMDAARNFFRPEFFNRLDKIVPFTSLSRAETARIAHRLIVAVRWRHGLAQRKCALHVDDRATERLVRAGYHPELGARALKRVVEQELAQPLADRLAAMAPGAPAMVCVTEHDGGLSVNTHALIEAKRRPQSAILDSTREILVQAAKRFLDRARARIASLEPARPMAVGDIRPEHHAYVTLTEQLRHVERLYQSLRDSRISSTKPHLAASVAHRLRFRRRRTLAMFNWDGNGNLLQELMTADSAQEAIRELADGLDHSERSSSDAARILIGECALLEAMLNDPMPKRVLFHSHDSDQHDTVLSELLKAFYKAFCETGFGYVYGAGSADRYYSWVITGPALDQLALHESGLCMLTRGEYIEIANVETFALDLTDSPEDILKRKVDVNRKTAFPCGGEVLRLFAMEYIDDDRWHLIYNDDPLSSAHFVDFRSGLISSKVTKDVSRQMVLSALPLPAEFEEGL